MAHELVKKAMIRIRELSADEEPCRLAIAQTARTAYARALEKALPKETH